MCLFFITKIDTSILLTFLRIIYYCKSIFHRYSIKNGSSITKLSRATCIIFLISVHVFNLVFLLHQSATVHIQACLIFYYLSAIFNLLFYSFKQLPSSVLKLSSSLKISVSSRFFDPQISPYS